MNVGGPPPPPPPPPFPGMSSPAPSKAPAETLRSAPTSPPAALAGAMMKDKKPFTYTPGGIDLSEIKSPRMQRRLQRNANMEGVRPSPLAQPPSPLASSQSPSCHPMHGMVPVLPVPGVGMTPLAPATPPCSNKRVPGSPKSKGCGPPPPPPPFIIGEGSKDSFSSNSISATPTSLTPLEPPIQNHVNQLPDTNLVNDYQGITNHVDNLSSENESGEFVPGPPPLPKPGCAMKATLASEMNVDNADLKSNRPPKKTMEDAADKQFTELSSSADSKPSSESDENVNRLKLVNKKPITAPKIEDKASNVVSSNDDWKTPESSTTEASGHITSPDDSFTSSSIMTDEPPAVEVSQVTPSASSSHSHSELPTSVPVVNGICEDTGKIDEVEEKIEKNKNLQTEKISESIILPDKNHIDAKREKGQLESAESSSSSHSSEKANVMGKDSASPKLLVSRPNDLPIKKLTVDDISDITSDLDKVSESINRRQLENAAKSSLNEEKANRIILEHEYPPKEKSPREEQLEINRLKKTDSTTSKPKLKIMPVTVTPEQNVNEPAASKSQKLPPQPEYHLQNGMDSAVPVKPFARMASPPPRFKPKSINNRMIRQVSLPARETPADDVPTVNVGALLAKAEDKSSLKPVKVRGSNISPTSGLIKAPLPWMCAVKKEREPEPEPEFLSIANRTHQRLQRQRSLPHPKVEKTLESRNSLDLSSNSPEVAALTPPVIYMDRSILDPPDKWRNTAGATLPRKHSSHFQRKIFQEQQAQKQKLQHQQQQKMLREQKLEEQQKILQRKRMLEQQQKQEKLQQEQFEKQQMEEQKQQLEKQRQLDQQSFQQKRWQPNLQQQPSSPQNTIAQTRPRERIIPIHIESNSPPSSPPVRFIPITSPLASNSSQPTYPKNYPHKFQANVPSSPSKNIGVRAVPYIVPIEIPPSSGNALEALQQMQQNLAQLNSGLQTALPLHVQQKISDLPGSRIMQNSDPVNQQNGMSNEGYQQPKMGAAFRSIQSVYDNVPETINAGTAPQKVANEAPLKYSGANIPSRTFRMLQQMTEDAPGPGQSDL